MAYTNSTDPDLQGQSDRGLHCLPLHQVFCEIHIKQNLGKYYGIVLEKFLGMIYCNSTSEDSDQPDQRIGVFLCPS